MTSGSLFRQTHLNHLLRIGLVLALVFAAWHVALHDINTSSDVSGHEECQACRLNHVPIADLPTLAWFVPLLILSLVLIIPVVQQPCQYYRYSLGARAPPLF